MHWADKKISYVRTSAFNAHSINEQAYRFEFTTTLLQLTLPYKLTTSCQQLYCPCRGMQRTDAA